MLKYMIQKGYVNVSKVLLSIYPQIGVSEQEVVVILKLFEMLKNNQLSISVSELSKKMAIDQNELSNILASLFNKDLLTLVVNYTKEGKAKESFNLDNLILRIEAYFESDLKTQEEKTNQNVAKKAISLVEETFKRSLTNFEVEMILSWVKEGETIDRIRKGLALAVKASKLNIKYVDKCIASLNNLEDSEYVLDDNKSKLLADFYRNFK